MRCVTLLIVILAAAFATLASAESRVSGTASYRERMALPPGAVFEARLEDVSIADAPSIEVGRVTLPEPGNPPIAFQISFDPQDIDSRHRYSVRAQISVGPKLLFVSDKMNPVLTNGAASDVQVWMIKVGETTEATQALPAQIGAHGLRLPASFSGALPCRDCAALVYRLDLWPDQVFHLRRTWQGPGTTRDVIGRWAADPDNRMLTLHGPAEEIRFAILGPDRIRLVPADGGMQPEHPDRMVLTAGVEFIPIEPHLPMRGMLTYDAERARFTDCLTGRDYPLVQDEDYEALEHAYLAAGAKPGDPIMASFDGTILQPTLLEQKDRPAVLVERFVGVWPGATCERAEGMATLINTYWKILRIDGAELSATSGRSEPNLILRDDGRQYTATVGCSQVNGSYSQEGDSLSFGPVAMTRMACEPPLDQWEAKLLDMLQRSARFRIDGQTLELLDADEASLGLLQAVYLY